MIDKHKVVTAAPTLPTQCVIGLDRDGVINRDLGTYVKSADQFEPIEGSLEGSLTRSPERLCLIQT